MSDPGEELGQQLTKLGCAGMSSGCLLTLLSPLIIVAVIALFAIAWPLLALVPLFLPAVLIQWGRYKTLLAQQADDEDVSKLAIWHKAGRQSWRRTLKFYGIAVGAVSVLSLLIVLLSETDTSRQLAPPSVSTNAAEAQEATPTPVTRRTELGTWRTTYSGVNITTTIYRTNDPTRFAMEQYLVVRGDGGRYEEQLVKRENRYYLPNGDDYFEVSLGCLHAYDSVGHIWSAC